MCAQRMLSKNILRMLLVFTILGEVCLVALPGCLRSKPSRFYLLSSQSGAAQTTGAPAAPATRRPLVIGLGPVSLADYLDRPQIVLRTDDAPIRLAEFDRWAESLKETLTQALQQNLSALLGTDQVLVGAGNLSRPVDGQVALDVTRLDGELGGEARLEGQWTLYGPDGKAVLATGKAAYREAVPGKTCQDLVRAESHLAALLCKDLATEILAKTGTR